MIRGFILFDNVAQEDETCYQRVHDNLIDSLVQCSFPYEEWKHNPMEDPMRLCSVNRFA